MGSYLPRYISGFAAAVGSATLPQGSLYSGASNGFNLLEAHWLAGAVGVRQVAMVRLTSTGTPGATQAVAEYDPDNGVTPTCTPVTTHTVAPGLGDQLHLFRVPGVVAAGAVFGFHDSPVECAPGAANGIGFLPLVASGGADVTFVWDEG